MRLLSHLLRQPSRHLFHSQHQQRQVRRLLAQLQAVVQFPHRQAAVVQFRLRRVAHAVQERAAHVLHSLVQLVLRQVDQVVVQVHALVVSLAPRSVADRWELVGQCVLRLQAALVQVVQVLVQVAQVVVLHSVVALVRVVQVLVQEHVQVVQALVALVVQVVVVLVVQVVDNAVLLKRNHALVVVKTSMKCCRKLQRVTQQVMQQFLRASSSSSVVRLRKSLLQS